MAAVLSVAGCSSSGGSGGSSSSRPGGVSKACDDSMQAVAKLDSNAPVSAGVALMERTLTACPSSTEWLAAAKNYTSSGVDHCVVCGNGDPNKVLHHGYCSDQHDFPACK
jgi:hypothetical protein